MVGGGNGKGEGVGVCTNLGSNGKGASQRGEVSGAGNESGNNGE